LHQQLSKTHSSPSLQRGLTIVHYNMKGLPPRCADPFSTFDRYIFDFVHVCANVKYGIVKAVKCVTCLRRLLTNATQVRKSRGGNAFYRVGDGGAAVLRWCPSMCNSTGDLYGYLSGKHAGKKLNL